jgi:predicted HTH transcriptional regulator
MTEDLFEELQEEGEGERVDFKEFNYDFFNSDKKIKDEARASFIKDIFSFANTPKPYKKSAYIVLGVKDNGELVGLFYFIYRWKYISTKIRIKEFRENSQNPLS